MDFDDLPGESEKVELEEFSMIVDPQASKFGRQLHETGYKPDEGAVTEFFDTIDFGGLTIIDVGGHYGYFSLLVTDSYSPERVVAFEPFPKNFAYLRANIELNDADVRVVNKAVSDETGSDVLLDIRYDENKTLMTEDVLPHYRNPPDVSGTISVETVALADYLDGEGIQQVDLIKVDVEGAELLVLDGIDGVWDRIDGFVIEIHGAARLRDFGHSSSDILKLLEEQEFQLYFAEKDTDERFTSLPAIGTEDRKRIIEAMDQGFYHLLALRPGSEIHSQFAADSGT